MRFPPSLRPVCETVLMATIGIGIVRLPALSNIFTIFNLADCPFPYLGTCSMRHPDKAFLVRVTRLVKKHVGVISTRFIF